MLEGSAGILEKFASDKPILIEKMKNFAKVVPKEMDVVGKLKPNAVYFPTSNFFRTGF